CTPPFHRGRWCKPQAVVEATAVAPVMRLATRLSARSRIFSRVAGGCNRGRLGSAVQQLLREASVARHRMGTKGHLATQYPVWWFLLGHKKPRLSGAL